MVSRRILLAFAALFLAGCQTAAGSSPPSPSGTKPRVGASFPILADIVRTVAGDRLEVVSVIPDGADLHTWEPSAQDLVRAASFRGFLFIGANNERFLEDGGFRQVLRDRGIPRLEYASQLDLIMVDKVIDHGDHVHDLREGDPHVWLDPRRVIAMLDPTVRFLSELDPEGASVFAANAERYAVALRALDTELATDFARIPPPRRRLVVFHNAFTYFADRYGFDVVEVVIKSPGREPSAKDIAALRDTIVAAGVPAVFKEPQFNARVLEQVAADLRVPVGVLLTDSFTPGVHTYLDLMRFNRDCLVTHLAQ
ncbi:MAG: ABC transporter substrate-binding protein [Dehalococcoidia bacterium]|nr:MAG: ABC transporter substrate-binding protein [Dehalococcoidia bacterium]